MKYQILKHGLARFEANSDTEALRRFRDDPSSQELRREKDSSHYLGRLIAYKDTGGNEHIANLERTQEEVLPL